MASRSTLLAVLALLHPVASRAQNAEGVLLGTEAALTGGAVLANTHDPAGAFYNPAGLAALQGASAQVSGTALQLTRYTFRHFLATNLPWGRLDQSVRSSQLTAFPAVGAYGSLLSLRLGVAAGIWVPEQASLGLLSTLHIRGPLAAGGGTLQVDYAQRVALTQKIDRTYFGAAAGYALRPGLRVGAALFAVYEREDDFFDLFAGATTDSTDPVQQGATASASLRGATSRFGARLGAGVQWDVTRALTLAAAVKTAGVSALSTGGTSTVSQTASFLPGAAPAVAFREVRASPDRLIEPWLVALGGAAEVAGKSLRAELDWQAPHARRRGVLNARLGVHHEWSEDLAWGAGAFSDRSGEDPGGGAVAVDFYGVAAGVDYRPPPVRAARGPSASWDVRASLAVRYALGTGRGPLLQANPFATGAADSSTGRVVAHSLSVLLGGALLF